MTEPTITVLYVNDNDRLTELLREYIQFQDDDIAVHTARNGEEALEFLETTDSVDCVVSDYEMPGMNGLDLLEAVRRRWTDLPFILFTGRGTRVSPRERLPLAWRTTSRREPERSNSRIW